MTVEQYAAFVGCAAWQDLRACEEWSRAELRSETNTDRQILLAQDVRSAQQAKFRHEETCSICVKAEIELVEREGVA